MVTTLLWQVARSLHEAGVSALCYHAGVDSQARAATQAAWQAGRVQVVVSTVAFGLGIDKPDVRFVVHHTMSKSLEAFYQVSLQARPSYGNHPVMLTTP